MRFHFTTNHSTPIEGKPHWFQFLTFEGEGETAEEAARSVEAQIPPGKAIIAWWAVVEDDGIIEPRKCQHCGGRLGAQDPGSTCGPCKFA
jgi:hypothetical protein